MIDFDARLDVYMFYVNITQCNVQLQMAMRTQKKYVVRFLC